MCPFLEIQITQQLEKLRNDLTAANLEIGSLEKEVAGEKSEKVRFKFFLSKPDHLEVSDLCTNTFKGALER